MTKHIIKLPEVIVDEFVKKLGSGFAVVLTDIGTFKITPYYKSMKVQMTNKGGKVQNIFTKKKEKFHLIGFKPHPNLKKRVK